MCRNTWTLFQSQDATLIYTNLSDQEYRKLENITNRFIIWNVLICVFALVTFNFLGEFQLSSITLFLCGLFFIILHIKNCLIANHQIKQYLCSTEWAKSQGYTPEKLKLHSFNSSQRG